MASRLGTPNNQGFLFTIVVMEVQTAWGALKTKLECLKSWSKEERAEMGLKRVSTYWFTNNRMPRDKDS